MAPTVEIIDFKRPVANCKNLFLTNIKTNEMNEADITNALYKAFSPFGLLYEIQVFPNRQQTFKASAKQGDLVASYYAFVKFYSYNSAQKARMTLNNYLKVGKEQCKITNAKRCKETDEGQTLYMSKCQELANHYLGFDGWISAIRCLEEDAEDCGGGGGGPRVRFFCVVDLTFPRQGLTTHGIGAWEERYFLQDPASKSSAYHKARKRSYQRALEHAFTQVLLVVVVKVKVTVELDTTQAEDELAERVRGRVAMEQVLTPRPHGAHLRRPLGGAEAVPDISVTPSPVPAQIPHGQSWRERHVARIVDVSAEELLGAG
ncbi:RAD52 motif-containing protein 1-like [Babylonia areolata]|uniref:RAD52 motif-containing protein 1-like n=1 Tax=Babylonia areolata TaxID=304850 RepID=UPI003FD497B8